MFPRIYFSRSCFFFVHNFETFPKRRETEHNRQPTSSSAAAAVPMSDDRLPKLGKNSVQAQHSALWNTGTARETRQNAVRHKVREIQGCTRRKNKNETNAPRDGPAISVSRGRRRGNKHPNQVNTTKKKPVKHGKPKSNPVQPSPSQQSPCKTRPLPNQ